MKKKDFRKHSAPDWWNPHRIVIGFADMDRRNNLLDNARNGVGQAEQRNNNVLLTVGDDEDRTQYLILNATL